MSKLVGMGATPKADKLSKKDMALKEQVDKLTLENVELVKQLEEARVHITTLEAAVKTE